MRWRLRWHKSGHDARAGPRPAVSRVGVPGPIRWPQGTRLASRHRLGNCGVRGGAGVDLGDGAALFPGRPMPAPRGEAPVLTPPDGVDSSWGRLGGIRRAVVSVQKFCLHTAQKFC